MYIKINGSDERYDASLMPFKTQNGNRGVKVLNGMPHTDKGFVMYDDNDVLFADYSDYIYSYGDTDDEYTTVQETIIPAECGYSPLPTPQISQQIASLNAKVNDITPYTETKQAYIDDTEVVFPYREGNITAYVADGQVPCNVSVDDEGIVVSFEALEEPAKVTISIL